MKHSNVHSRHVNREYYAFITYSLYVCTCYNVIYVLGMCMFYCVSEREWEEKEIFEIGSWQSDFVDSWIRRKCAFGNEKILNLIFAWVGIWVNYVLVLVL